MSQTEREYHEIWLELREEILNKSNGQLRAAEMEMEEYDIQWLKKRLIFKFEDEEQRND
jgi:hypothetical protein